jgi:signal transduction histidine kinase
MDDKFEGLEAVLAKVAHDLRTPLAVVHTTTNMLLSPKYQLTPEQVREQLERIRRNAERMSHMVGELADMAQIGSGSLMLDTQPTDIGEVLREVVAANDKSARDKGVALSCQATVALKHPEADRPRLAQVFRTLVEYAIGATSSGGHVRVRAGLRDDAAQIEIVASGSNLSPEDLLKVFEPWRDGAGLGLFIGKGIIEAHRGQIRCDAQPGVGTTFIVTLPLTH